MYSQDEIESKISDSKDSLQKSLEKYAPDFARDFTLEEEEKIRKGELSPEEALELISGTNNLPQASPSTPDGNVSEYSPDPAQTAKPANTEPQTSKPPASDPSASIPPSQTPSPVKPSGTGSSEASDADSKQSDKIISKYVAKLYLYKAEYIAKLGKLEQSAKDEYLALPEDKRTESEKSRILLSKISEASALEKVCDSQVNALLSDMKKELKECGADLSIIDVIKKAYTEEKALKKAYYLGILND